MRGCGGSGHQLTSDGIAVAIHDLGGNGPPVLFAHATGFHGLVWRPVADRLRDSFHCWAFDERGHGDTPAPADGDFRWEGFARDAISVVDELRLNRPYGVGHSGGGAALLAYVLGQMAHQGVTRVTLSTQETNVVSQRLYKGFGFRQTNEVYNIYGKLLVP